MNEIFKKGKKRNITLNIGSKELKARVIYNQLFFT